MQLDPQHKKLLDDALARSGQRTTRQREHIFALLLEKRDHPTADEVYDRARESMPGMSLATVYNCLETLVESKLIRQVNFERQPTRFCPNLSQHAHFHCKQTGEVYDVDLPPHLVGELKQMLPEGFEAEQIDISFTGASSQHSPPNNADRPQAVATANR
ncbi:MAG: Fur family transcriptional regulator [Opitutales bacterium]